MTEGNGIVRRQGMKFLNGGKEYFSKTFPKNLCDIKQFYKTSE